MSRIAAALALMGACAYGPGEPVSRGATHGNLTVYVISDPAAPREAPYVSLSDAVAKGWIMVSEIPDGADVNVLHVENRGDRPVFIQAGQLATGGKQDRAVAADAVVPPRSGARRLDVFCVEPDRWEPRADSSGGSSISGCVFEIDEPDTLPTRELRLAALREADQGRVWEEVAPLTEGGKSSSLAEALKDPDLRAAADRAVAALQPAVDARAHAVGLAVEINGALTQVHLYGTVGLFRTLAPALLRAAAIEAHLKRDGEVVSPGGPPQVRALIDRRGTEGWAVFETRDESGARVHVQMLREE
jgi:hypothetical protein